MRHTTTALTALLLLTLGAEPVAADSLTATLGQPLKEVAHKADIRLKNGVAIFRVRRTFANAGTKHEEARLTINLPYGAAATGLRIRGKKQWFKGELMERNKAAELYQKLTGIGPHEPRDPALLSWNWANELQLNVFPVPPGKKATVEYTKPHVLRCVARHKPVASWQVRLRFHATYDEVVDVLGRSKKGALQKCLVEGAWQIRLPGNFTKERDTKDITLP